jgi:hypothetical protein
MWVGTWEEYISYYLNPRKPPYTDKEVAWLTENIRLRGDFKKLAIAWYAKFKYSRPVVALHRKIGKITGIGNQLEKPLKGHAAFDDFPKEWLDSFHSTLRLKLGQKFKGTDAKYIFICDEEHETLKQYAAAHTACIRCSGSFVGGIPKNDFRPGLVYLIYVPVWNAVKPGEAIGEGIEAIKERYRIWPLPEDYEILAYDQSTRTEAAEHEQFLLDGTIQQQFFQQVPNSEYIINNRSGITVKKFSGWTEFREVEVIKDLTEAEGYKTWLI